MTTFDPKQPLVERSYYPEMHFMDWSSMAMDVTIIPYLHLNNR